MSRSFGSVPHKPDPFQLAIIDKSLWSLPRHDDLIIDVKKRAGHKCHDGASLKKISMDNTSLLYTEKAQLELIRQRHQE